MPPHHVSILGCGRSGTSIFGELFEQFALYTYYWQMRHPLDTICSLRVGIAQDWGHHPRPSDWQA